ncbi:radical SAM/SPASM domain-containing protein [Chloroflexota bacterium]
MSFGRIGSLLKRFVFTRSLTPRRLVNFCLVTFQHQFLKNSRVVGHPVELVIDVCNICNLHCPLCPTGQGRDERVKQQLSLADFKKIIDELGAYLYRVDLHNWGEPLLNEDIFNMITYAHSRRIMVDVSTNLTRYDESVIDKLVTAGPDRLIISLSGLDQETYGKYHIGGDIEKVLAGTNLLIARKAARRSKTPAVTWRFLVMRHNEAQIPRVRQMTREMGIDLDLMPIHGDMGQDLFWSTKMKREQASDWLPKSEEYSFESMKPCAFLWVQAVINCGGSVSPCCAVYQERYDFGNMFTEGGFMNIWNNNSYRAARRIIRQKKTLEKGDEENICSCCLTTSRQH